MHEPLREIVNAYLDDDRRTIVVRERVDGRIVTRRVRAEHVTWHRDDDLTKAMRQQLSALPTVRSVKRQGKWVRVCWSDHYAREDGRRGMKANQIDTFEGDVDPVLLFLVEDGGRIAKPRRCYLDIETDSRVPLSQKESMRVLSWVLVDHDTGEETIGVLEQESDADERRLLQALADAMLPYDQVCVWEGNWSGGEFDSVVVPARWRATGVSVDERVWIWTNQLAVWDRHSSAESGAEGSLKLDVIAHEQLGEGKEQVPQFVIDRFGEDRCKRGLGMLAWDLWEAGGRFRQLLLRYNAKDARLLRMLELRKGFIALALALASLCGLNPIDRSMDPTRLMDGFMLRLGRKQDRRFATRERFEKEDMPKKFKGAVVFPPKSVPNEKPKDGEEPWSREQAAVWRRDHGFKNGILHGVHVCDFSGMYPSIMMTFNLGAEMIAGWAKDPKELKPNTCMSPGTGLVTRVDEHASITFAFREMASLRKHYADLAAQLPFGTPEWIDAMAMSTAFKVAMNSFYGAGGTPFSRFYNRDVSEATTQNAVHFLLLSAAEAGKRTMVVAYSDTDSLAVVGPSISGFSKFVSWLNEVRFPSEVTKHGCIENHIKIAFEKSYDRIVYVTKKRYCATPLHYKHTTTCNHCRVTGRGAERHVLREDEVGGEPGSVDIRTLTCRDCGRVYDRIPKFLGKPEIKGLAFKRGETTVLARELQAKVIDLLVGGLTLKGDDGKEAPANPGVETPTEDVTIYRKLIERYRDRIIVSDLKLHEVVHSKGLSKSLRDFAKDASDAHVRVARMMLERGQVVSRGMKIEYVVVDASVSPQRVVPAEDFVGECDRFHLWEQTWDPSKQLLEAAFPDEDWDEWDALRDQKPRSKGGKKGAPLEGQLGLAIPDPAAKGERKLTDQDEVAIPAYRAADLRVTIPESAGKEGVDRVLAVLTKHPGARSVVVVIALDSGHEAVVKTPLRVSPGPKLRIAIDAAVAGPPPTEHAPS